jgi:hypothetical protein
MDIEDRCADGTGVADGEAITATSQHDEWIQVASGKWLPKKVLLEKDTSIVCPWEQLCDAFRSTEISELSLANCGIGPMALNTLAKVISDSAAIDNITLDGNPITGANWNHKRWNGGYENGDVQMSGFIAICKALKKSSVSKLSLASCGLGSVAFSTLANAMSDIAAMNFLDVSRNSIGADGASALLNVIPDTKLQTIVIGKSVSISVGGSDPELAKMTSLDYSDQGFGPGELMMISSLVMPYIAAVQLLNISANKCFGVRNGRHARPGETEYTEDSWTTICDALKGTQIETLDLSDIGLTPSGLTIFSNAMSAIAALNELRVGTNPAIGRATGVQSIREGAETGIKVEKGVIANVDGRWGEVKGDPDSDNDVKLTWFDDGTRSGYTKTDKLTTVAAKSDAILEYPGVEALCTGLADTKISILDISNIGLDAVGLAKFVTLFTSLTPFRAALSTVNLCDNANIKVADIEAVKIAAPNVSIEH